MPEGEWHVSSATTIWPSRAMTTTVVCINMAANTVMIRYWYGANVEYYTIVGRYCRLLLTDRNRYRWLSVSHHTGMPPVPACRSDATQRARALSSGWDLSD